MEILTCIAWPVAAVLCAMILASTWLDKVGNGANGIAELAERVAIQAKDIAELKRKVSKLNLIRGIVEE